MTRLRAIAAALAALAVALAALGAWWALRPRQVAESVPTARPTRGEFVVALSDKGVLQSDDAVTVSTGEAGGEIAFIVSDGATVRAGEVFCRIEARDLLQREAEAELSLKQAREEIERTRESAEQDYENARRAAEKAQQDLDLWRESTGVRIKQAQDQLEFDRAELERLRLEYERKRRLAQQGMIAGAEAEIAHAAYEAQRFKVEQSEKELELSRRQIASEMRQKQTAVEAAQQKAEVARQRIEEQVVHAQERARLAERDLAKIRASLRDATILAPASGIVTLFTTWRGGERGVWRAGDQVSPGRALGTISGGANMSVASRIKETNISLVHKGQAAEIEFEALAGRIFRGTVSSVSAVAREVYMWEDPTAEPNQRVFDVWTRVIQDRPANLKPGLNAKIRFIVKRVPNALYVPLQAVFERQGRNLVFVRCQGRFVAREVKLGERNDEAVVIRSGLSESDVVALQDPTRQAAAGSGRQR